MKEPRVILVDVNDNEIGTMGKTDAHRKACLHRAVSVFIFNSRGEWLIQRRALTKYHSGGLWTNACCSHPLPGESATDAANRRLKEEIGMVCNLTELFSFIYQANVDNGLVEHELDHVFYGLSDETPVPESVEVMDWKYISYDELISDIAEFPDAYTAWFKKIVEQVNRSLAKINVSDRIPDNRI